MNISPPNYWNGRVESTLQALAVLLVSVSPRLETLGIPVVRSGNVRWIIEDRGVAHGFISELFMQRACARRGDIPYMQRLRTVNFLVGPRSAYPGMIGEPYNIDKGLNHVRRLPAIKDVRFN